MDEDELGRIPWRGMAEFQRLLGRHAPDARLAETPHYVASAVPGVEASLVNAAVPLDGAPLRPHLDAIRDFYAHTPKWGAWLDPANTGDAEALINHGLVLDSTPVLMVASLDDVQPPHTTPDLVTPTMEEVGAVNDAAYGTPEPHLARTTASFPPGAFHAYGARVDGSTPCVLLIADVDTDAFVTLVATLPQHRGRRLASKLLAYALHEAKQRGQQTTSLQASKLGQRIYSRLGYRPLGEAHLYERRPA
jgi:ribosomal protein S18 acetylase RimI-like enzyme